MPCWSEVDLTIHDKTSLNHPPEPLGLFLGWVLPKSLSLECSSPSTARACSTAATGGTAVSSSWGGSVCRCSSDSTTASRLLLPAHKSHPGLSVPQKQQRSPPPQGESSVQPLSPTWATLQVETGRKSETKAASTFGRGQLPHNELLPLLPEEVDHVLCLHRELCAQGLQDLQLKAPAGLQAPEAAPCLEGQTQQTQRGERCPCQGKPSLEPTESIHQPCQGLSGTCSRC